MPSHECRDFAVLDTTVEKDAARQRAGANHLDCRPDTPDSAAPEGFLYNFNCDLNLPGV
jgi:hypothetical protein